MFLVVVSSCLMADWSYQLIHCSFQLSEGVGTSVGILEKFVSMSSAGKTTRMPTMLCFGSVSDDGCSVTQNWEFAADVDASELSCQVSIIYTRCCSPLCFEGN